MLIKRLHTSFTAQSLSRISSFMTFSFPIFFFLVIIIDILFFKRYTLDVEAVSCDEMYVNLCEVLDTLDCSVEEFVSYVRGEIIEKTQCQCSAGIGSNK